VGVERKLALVAIGVALLSVAANASARSEGSLVLAPASGPQPYFVPPTNVAESTGSEDAMQDFRRAISEAAFLQQRQTAVRCGAGQPQGGTPEQRFAWAATCRYSRR
jgi:hypothetical protein